MIGTAIIAILIVVVAAIQYGLVIYGLRDLARRPSVRGNNKIGWGLLILAVQFIGAFAGPAQKIRRDAVASVLRGAGFSLCQRV